MKKHKTLVIALLILTLLFVEGCAPFPRDRATQKGDPEGIGAGNTLTAAHYTESEEKSLFEDVFVAATQGKIETSRKEFMAEVTARGFTCIEEAGRVLIKDSKDSENILRCELTHFENGEAKINAMVFIRFLGDVERQVRADGIGSGQIVYYVGTSAFSEGTQVSSLEDVKTYLNAEISPEETAEGVAETARGLFENMLVPLAEGSLLNRAKEFKGALEQYGYIYKESEGQFTVYDPEHPKNYLFGANSLWNDTDTISTLGFHLETETGAKEVEVYFFTDKPQYYIININEAFSKTEVESFAQIKEYIAQPSETDNGAEHGDSMLVPPSNTTDYDINFMLGSTEMKWNFFDNSWSFALCGEDSTPEGITLVHKPASDTKDMVLEYGQEYFLESWDGNCWNLFFRGSIPSELSEKTIVFSGSTITEPVPVQINWGTQCGALVEGKYRVGMYYTATRSSGGQEKKLCYAKFLVYGLESDGLIKKCSSALEEILRKDTYHIQRTDYMLEHRLKQDSHYYVSNIWKSKQNYYSEVTYYYNSNGEIKSNLGMLLWDRKGYDWNTLLSPDRLWSERDDLTEASFQTWAFGLDCTTKTLEKVIQTENSITFVFLPASVSGRRDKIQEKAITYYFDQNDELVGVTLEYILENQEKMMEVELLVKDSSNESVENIIRNQYVAATPVN